jgi:isoaspartyl peptidase/L-asparaginase-like protein (Ntn-hydrolase superfamily)
MKTNRREFVKRSAFFSIGAVGLSKLPAIARKIRPEMNFQTTRPIVVSTWKHGVPANVAAWDVLSKGGTALDAVEAGVRVPEGDPNVMSVGLGGLPDEQGKVTLDACIMDWRGNAGSVAALEHVVHPISVARLVMERTNHVLLAGEGALEFALAQGFKKEELLTDESRKRWLKWKESKSDNWVPPEEVHDTISMLALDTKGNLSGACTTSGLAWKIHGRVGDCAIVGGGVYVDNDVGAASSTGFGEATIRSCGSFLVVENMRRGMTPQEACEDAIKRVIKMNPKRIEKDKGYFDCFLALSKAGEIGACSVRKGFQYAAYKDGKNVLLDAPFVLG